MIEQIKDLIQQWCEEEEGTPAFMIHALIKEVEDEKGTWLNKLLLWLATRPTCTATERKFLDEIREKGKWSAKDEAIYLGQYGVITQAYFDTDIKELVNDTKTKTD